MADWTPEQLADQNRICQCKHFKNTHERGTARCCFGALQRAYGYDDTDCPCQAFVEDAAKTAAYVAQRERTMPSQGIYLDRPIT